MSQKKYTLIVEWFDPSASLIRQFYFSYYLPNNQIEMHDMKNHKVFLKKIHYPDIQVKDLYIGNILICYSRQLKVVDFGDAFTRKQLSGDQEQSNKTYGMIKPDSYLNIGKIIEATEKQFSISNLKMFRMAVPDAEKFYGEHQGKSFYPNLINFMTSDFAVGMELVAPGAIKKWRQFIGPTNSLKAKEEAPNSIRALYGTDGTKNACHGSDSPQSVERELGIIFSRNLANRPRLTNCTLCIIKPHAVKNKLVGRVVDEILQAGFEISAMQMVWLDSAVSEQFYTVYKFLPECKRMIDHLSSGPCVALEVRQEHAVEDFRKFCGPYDPEIGKKLQPNTLRARYGVDRVHNVVHCTDLPEDGSLEVQFIFQNILG